MNQRKPKSSVRAYMQNAAVAVVTLLLVASLTLAQSRPATRPAHNFARWEKSIAAFAEQDRTSPPEKGQILFVGASSIVRWKSLAEDFPKHRVLTRGFGGNEIIDSAH